MNITNCKKNILAFLMLFVVITLFVTGCQQGGNDKNKKSPQEELREKLSKEKSPVLPPDEAMKKFQIENGFQIQLVASEPLVSAPVALSFDNKGRIWAVEMNAYMPDTSGNGEKEPIGKIVILEDKDHDGKMDTRKVFMDSLVLPRAICLFDDGVLVAEPPKLWFVENNNDKAGKRYLVDSNYATGGNVEHQPNGLLRGLDNWIYSAKSATRYRRVGKNKWIKDHTHFRGQWGISQDEWGRLYYNTNSENLLGDYFAPSLGAANTHQKRVTGYDETIVADTRVYPVHPTPGVNRGYMKGILDDSLRLINFTAACGPVVFTSNLFGKDYYDNAFIAEPAANLIKRDILTFSADSTTGHEAYEKKEFLASTDERFRPVNLYVGPDGSMYIADMYRGIIQHKTYLTHYLAGEIVKRGLEEPLNCGRIYKVVPEGAHLQQPVFSDNKDSLLAYLGSPSSWIRQTAHDLIVDRQMTELASPLHTILSSGNNIIQKITSMWALEGLGQLKTSDLTAMSPTVPAVMKQQILTAAVAIMKSRADADIWIKILPGMLKDTTPGLAAYIAYLAGNILKFSPKANDFLLQILSSHENNPYVADAVISGLFNREASFLKLYQQKVKDTSDFFAKRLKGVIENAQQQKLASLASKKLDKNMLEGQKLFTVNCRTCHGDDGNGIKGLGAPLNGSDWVQGDKNKVISIVLYGLTGPVKVSGKMYAPPEVTGTMPGMSTNDQLGDKDIANIISYIRNAWNNKAGSVSEEDVKKVRQKYGKREEPFTMKELMEIH